MSIFWGNDWGEEENSQQISSDWMCGVKVGNSKESDTVLLLHNHEPWTFLPLVRPIRQVRALGNHCSMKMIQQAYRGLVTLLIPDKHLKVCTLGTVHKQDGLPTRVPTLPVYLLWLVWGTALADPRSKSTLKFAIAPRRSNSQFRSVRREMEVSYQS